MNNDEIEPLVSLPLPFNPDAKIFNCVDEETGEIIGESYSYSDFLQKIDNISSINEELLGSFESNLIPSHVEAWATCTLTTLKDNNDVDKC